MLASLKERGCEVDTVSGLRAIAVLFVLFTVVSSVSVLGVQAADVEEVISPSVGGVEETVVEAYRAVLEAEEAGADVSGLLDRLDVAGEYLALAKMCMRTGNLEGAAGNASLSVEALDGLMDDAEVLRDRAMRESDERFRMAIGGSAIGIVVVMGGCWLGWRWFKKRYKRMQQTEVGVV
jgi:hypothetical protein